MERMYTGVPFLFLACFFSVSCATSSITEAETVSYEYTETAVTIRNGDHGIPAIVTIPQGAITQRFPAVVMLHGFGSNKDEAGNGYKLFAPELAKSGIASIRFDFIGSGDSKEDYIHFDFNSAVSDATAAAAYIASRSNINADKIGIMGWSLGGTIALLAAGRNSVYKSVATWAGTPLPSMFASDSSAYETAKKEGYALAAFDWREPLKLGIDAFEIALKTNVLSEFSQSRAPVLAINGGRDNIVFPENAGAIVNASPNSNSKTYIIEDADHTFNIFSGDMTAFNDLCKSTLVWFLKTL